MKSRDYRVTETDHQHGEKHMFEGKEYIRLNIGGALFDKETDTTQLQEESKADFKLFRTNKKSYYKKYQV